MSKNNRESIVITGMSGRFPECEDIEEFKNKLFTGIDMVTENDRRWPCGIFGLPKRMGTLKNLSHFDAKFFGVHPKQADEMDPQLRILLELTYEALVDAGINPKEVKGANTGVFIGASDNVFVRLFDNDPERLGDYTLLGFSGAMYANRISYAFDWKGPSYILNTGCSSSLYALHEACEAIRNDKCEAAIVGAVNLFPDPTWSLLQKKQFMVSPEGKCKSFDESANGYVRSEAVVVIYLQKACTAKRIYATVLGIDVNCDGYKTEGITFPSADMQKKLMKRIYKDNNIDPLQVSYIEAHGTGTPAGDPQEISAIDEVLCRTRKEPLFVGSVKSNMGHAELAAGLCAIVKALIIAETGVIPANLHFTTPSSKIPSINEGRIKVVEKNRVFTGSMIAVTSAGFGGTNAHLILEPHLKQKISHDSRILPKICCISGCTEDAVNHMLDKIIEHEDDDEFLALVDEVYSSNIVGHPYRGYVILNSDNIRKVAPAEANKRPVWFLYSGMGSQWPGMAKDFMKFAVFRNSVEKLTDILKPMGINLEYLMTTEDESIFDNLSNSFLAICGIQIALTDLLLSIGIEPDGVIGHSTGEIVCGYADGGLTAAQALLAAKARYDSVFESESKRNGAMAAVALSKEKAEKRCPPEVYIACENSENNVTISGPRKAVKKLTAQLEAENIFARMVRAGEYALHSKHIITAAPKLKKALEGIIPQPKRRTSKWISSSIPESQWNTSLAHYCSADYYVHNLISPVLFRDALRHVPDNAIVIEIAPYGFMQAVLRKSSEFKAEYINLVNKAYRDNVMWFLSSIGQLYNVGCQPKISKLYPPVTFPVGKGTAMISPLIKWDHSHEWDVPTFSTKAFKNEIVYQIRLDEKPFLSDHKVDGRVIYPAVGYLVLVWESLAKLNGNYGKTAVTFEDITFNHTTILTEKSSVEFTVNISQASGKFEVCERDTVAVSGRVWIPKSLNNVPFLSKDAQTTVKNGNFSLTTDDIYKIFRLRGYDYGEAFRGIMQSDDKGTFAKLKWENNWITFLDSMLHLWILGSGKSGLFLPIKLQKLVIDPEEHQRTVENFIVWGVPVTADHQVGIIKTTSVFIKGADGQLISKKQHMQMSPRLERYGFIPYELPALYDDRNIRPKEDIINVMLQIVFENIPDTLKFKVAEISECTNFGSTLTSNIQKIIEDYSNKHTEATIVVSESTDMLDFPKNCVKVIQEKSFNYSFDSNFHLIVLSNMQSNRKAEILSKMKTSEMSKIFILLEENINDDNNNSVSDYLTLQIISKQRDKSKVYTLLRRSIEVPTEVSLVEINDEGYSWVEPLKAAMKDSDETGKRIYLYVKNKPTSGVVGMVNCLRLEQGAENLRCFFIQEEESSPFTLENYLEQVKKDLVHNVLKDGVWGSYYYLPLEIEKNKTKIDTEYAKIDALSRGDLSSICWIQAPLPNSREHCGKELCTVYYAALNWRDIMVATEKLSATSSLSMQTDDLGCEFSGRDSKGRRVMGIMESKSLATKVLVSPECLWEIPEDWSLEDAATVPVVYATSYYALIIRGRMQPGESILIHAGAGGVGIAAITIALHMNCKVFTTVGSEVKRNFLKEKFPELTDSDIGNSRDSSFEDLILSRTNGYGVNLVLNCLDSELLQASLRCLSRGGRFLEIGKADMLKHTSADLGAFLKNITFHAICLDDSSYWKESHEKVVKLVNEGIRQNVVQPLPRSVFNKYQAEQAFRFMASAKHIGKVLLRIRDEENLKLCLPKALTVNAVRRTYMNPNKTYVIIGGLGGFGLELCEWLISRGATKVILNTRHGIKTGYQTLCVKRWRDKDIDIIISTIDASTKQGAHKLLQEANDLGPVGGIFNLALVLHDAFIQNQSEETFMKVCKSKIDITEKMDTASRALAPQIDHFVVFSSVACRGNPGQTNYAYGNSAAERICEARREAGLPGLAIQWGKIGDVGYVTEQAGGKNLGVALGIEPQSMDSCLDTVDLFLQCSSPILCSAVFKKREENKDGGAFPTLLNHIMNLLGIKDINTVSNCAKLADFGMDSLLVTEIREILERNCNLRLTVKQIREFTVQNLRDLYEDSYDDNNNYNQKHMPNNFKKRKLQPTECLLKMLSKCPSSKTNVFVLHPIEGFLQPLENVFQAINASVYGLQCTQSVPQDTINVLAEYYLEQIRSVQSEGSYTLVGYSFGACVAWEIATIMEKAHEKVHLVLIDGSPLCLKILTDDFMEKCRRTGSDADIRVFVLAASLIADINREKVTLELMKIESPEERISRLVKIVTETTQCLEEEVRSAITNFYKRIHAVYKYKTTTTFNGNVTLIKSEEGFMGDIKDSKADYRLSEICHYKPIVHTVEGDHSTMMTIPSSVKRIAEIINDTLENRSH